LTLWSTIEKREVSGRCARAREKRRCRGGRSGLTVTGGDLVYQWRRGGFQIKRPGGGVVRVLGGRERVRVERMFYGHGFVAKG
jgi:hypothetical protein